MFVPHYSRKGIVAPLIATTLCGVLLNSPALAQTQPKRAAKPIAPTKLWKKANAVALLPDYMFNPITSRLTTYGAFQLDMNAMLATLKQAPKEFTVDIRKSPLVIALPMPDGTTTRFSVVESSILSAQIAAAHPEIKTYIGQGIDDPTATVRIDHTPDGFHAMIISPNGEVIIDPYTRGETLRYISYFKADIIPAATGFKCEVQGNNVLPVGEPHSPGIHPFVSSGPTLRTYRLALSCDAEYAAFFGGTTAGAMNAMVTTVNRVNGVYETEVAVRVIIVKFNIYTVIAGEPFTDSDSEKLLDQNQLICDGANTANTGPGDGGYDIGHVFTTGGGGLAGLGVVGTSGQKAKGETGSSSPSGDAYDIDYVAHEFGHQFGAQHPFNAVNAQSCTTNTRVATAAYEPGSGTTIMAYAGICDPQNVQPHSDPYFHTYSYDQIVAYISSGDGDISSVHTNTGNNPPTVNAGANYTIPQGTPFTLTATGSDPNGDALTYSWEEFDLGAPTSSAGTITDAPYFRVFSPTVSPARTFLNLPDLLANNSTPYESLPLVNRTLNFRVVARDNKAGGGGVDYSAMQVAVNGMPFALTNRTSAFTWNAGTSQTVTWTVGGGGVAANVNILLSTNGGTTFTPLASNVPNTGSATVVVPAVATTQARLEVQAVGNIFFDVSRVDSSIVQNMVTVSGTLTFERLVANAPAQNVTFTFRPTSGTTFTKTVSVPVNGVFSLSGVPSGNYSLHIKSERFLAKNVSANASAGNVSGVTATLLAGDTNNNNIVDVDDLFDLLSAFNTAKGDGSGLYEAYSTGDIDQDGQIDVNDLWYLLANFNVSGDK